MKTPNLLVLGSGLAALAASALALASPPARTAAILSVRSGGAFGPDGKYAGGTMADVKTATMPKENGQGSGWIRYEGPAIESDLVGFRVFLDARNKVDVFGKRRPGLALKTASGDYHAVYDWGADVLKVGESLGLGSAAAMTPTGPVAVADVERRTVTVVENGPDRAALRFDYRGWQVAGTRVDATATLATRAGSRCAEHRFSMRGKNKPPLVTGIVKHADAPDLVTGAQAGMRYWYTWGKQAEQGDALGLAIIARDSAARAGPPNPLSHLIALDQTNGEARWWLCSMWGLEPSAPTSAAAFEAELRREAAQIGAGRPS